jgi:hypothetical protein
MATNTASDAVYSTLKQLYHTYRHTEHIPSKGNFFSPTCMQVCRPMPNYAAIKRDTIVQYLLEAAGFKDVQAYERAQSSSGGSGFTSTEEVKNNEPDGSAGSIKVKALRGKSYYSIRPLSTAEASEILPEDIVAPLGMTPLQLDELRQTESWIGMRVDLWDDDITGKGRLIKVKYWWREEVVDGQAKWMQCLHDILSIGERDGSEGEDGQVLE